MWASVRVRSPCGSPSYPARAGRAVRRPGRGNAEPNTWKVRDAPASGGRMRYTAGDHRRPVGSGFRSAAFLGDIDRQLATIHVVAVQGVDCRFGFRRGGHLDEAETA